MAFVWLLGEAVHLIHQKQIAEHGGESGLRDEGLLSSALARPQNLLAYSESKPDIAALDAAYAFGIARNHPFIDGNKRTAYVAMRVFLILNGSDIEVAEQEDKYQTYIKLAEGSLTEEELTIWIREHLITRSTKTIV